MLGFVSARTIKDIIIKDVFPQSRVRMSAALAACPAGRQDSSTSTMTVQGPHVARSRAPVDPFVRFI